MGDELRQIPFSAIVEGENWRLFYGDLRALAVSIATRGLVTPLRVTAREEAWVVVAGFRRRRAIELLRSADEGVVAELERLELGRAELASVTGPGAFETVPCLVTGYEDQASEALANLASDGPVHRITVYELGQRAALLRARGVTDDAIGIAVGKSEAYVGQCRLVVERSAPEILQALERGAEHRDPTYSFDRLVRWSRLDHAQQRAEWVKLCGTTTTTSRIKRAAALTRPRLLRILSRTMALRERDPAWKKAAELLDHLLNGAPNPLPPEARTRSDRGRKHSRLPTRGNAGPSTAERATSAAPSSAATGADGAATTSPRPGPPP